MSDDIRLDVLRDAIASSKLDGQTKDVLADDLKYAQDINGTADEALRGIKRLLISGVRRELLAHDRTEKAIAAHKGKCALTGGAGGAATWIVLLTPWRWPVALMCFSPFLGDLAAKVILALK